jgi:heme oxygenase (biliverdin-IX-beta and delta-forming)
MAAGEEAAPPDDRTTGDVLRMLRTGTATEHADVEQTLGLLDPALSPSRLTEVLTRMHGFWLAAEAGIEEWARHCPADAAAVTWARRRRADLFAADLQALGAGPATATPGLADVDGTDAALGRMYVLEGSTLGGTFIDRHLSGLPQFAGVRLRSFSPYGTETGAMWHAFRRATRDRVAAGGDADAMVASARDTFAALAAWCRPVGAAA